MTNNLIYENFIRFAFEQAFGHSVERWGDPARLANTDMFSDGNLSKVKAAVSYSMSILNNILENDYHDHAIVQENYDRLDSIIDDVIAAPDKNEVLKLINEYRVKFFPVFRQA